MTQTITNISMFCEAATPVIQGDVAVWLECGEPSTAAFRYACIHEHIRIRATCPAHRPEPGIVGCQACFQLGHDCEMTAVAVPDQEIPC